MVYLPIMVTPGWRSCIITRRICCSAPSTAGGSKPLRPYSSRASREKEVPGY